MTRRNAAIVEETAAPIRGLPRDAADMEDRPGGLFSLADTQQQEGGRRAA